MDEQPKKKRPWFQFHLFTVIILLFLAGGMLLWLNFNVLEWIACAIVLAGIFVTMVFLIGSIYSQFQWRRFQVHLSTAIILQFMAGLLLWANMTPQREYIYTADLGRGKVYRAGIIEYGWPFQATKQHQPVSGGQAAGWMFTNPLVVLNFGIAIGILCAVWYACERRIRRQEAKASPPQDGKT